MVDVPSIPPASVVAPAEPARPSAPVAGVVSLLLGIFCSVVLLGVRTFAASINEVVRQDMIDSNVVGTVLGVFGVGSILPIAAGIVLGHLGARKRHARGRVIAGVGLGIGYLNLALWFNRIVLATIEIVATHDPGSFFFWVFDWS
jgi:hypothetical protein